MRLPVCLLLVTLALCCYEANAVPCASLVKEMGTFLIGSDTAMKIQLAKYNAPKEEVAAKLQVKKCTDGMSSGDRKRIIKILAQILVQCGANDINSIIS
ncbi:PREDICTED: secretoglobin family 1D member 2-like [Galeopterus variegatus]|uniref:Uteroglobin n=1 Tax=Galeopterus variegatus TaxID=482537 RepID=A0ABM0SAK3_GALVR|nr:PREDICTED: secretoglobin family 1D member 2-like [Galeopterus variegatus]